MNNTVEINEGEIRLTINSGSSGKITFTDLGLKDEDLSLENGLLRLVFVFEDLSKHNFFQTPTIEVSYKEEVGETHWQCDYNGETILDKMDHHGRSTVVLLNRKILNNLEHRHENEMVLHAEFPQAVNLIAAHSYIHLF